MNYICKVCGYVYDEGREGVPFADLPESWVCPLCGASKALFAPDGNAVPAKPPAPAVAPLAHDGAEGRGSEDDMVRLTAGELAALCSSLARGCEKQYKDEEAGLFREIAAYFAAAAPEVPGADIDRLSEWLRDDLQRGYPALASVAAEQGDRGTQRVRVWGEKVTAVLGSLVDRYRREGEAFLAGTQVWVCTVCGFVYVGDAAPELCPVCKVPAWKFERVEGRRSA